MKLQNFAHGMAVALVTSLFTACASAPPPPDWQLNAHGATERAVAAYLSGDSRVEALEWERARRETARTGQPVRLARIELLRCATRVASLVPEPCPAFEALRPDAPAAERAYADYLGGRAAPPNSTSLASKTDPLSRLVAAGVLMQTGQASPADLQLAVDTASAQGWSRPLLAWLQAQARLAQLANEVEEAARLGRRIELVLRGAPAAP